jgi:hypothetical protein
VLNLARNRWCGRIGREHKSNGVFYVVDFRVGACFQKCHDPDCRGFRGEPHALPPDAAAEGALLDAMAPPQPQQPQDAWRAEDAWLDRLTPAQLAALDGHPPREDDADADGWWAALPPEQWAALDAAAAAAARRTL